MRHEGKAQDRLPEAAAGAEAPRKTRLGGIWVGIGDPRLRGQWRSVRNGTTDALECGGLPPLCSLQSRPIQKRDPASRTPNAFS